MAQVSQLEHPLNHIMENFKVKKSYLYNSCPDLERYPHQTSHDEHAQRQIRQQKEKEVRMPMEYQEKQDQALYQPILWWFTSTAFPLIAGSFGPVASLFSICALLKSWRIDTINRSQVPDPPWLTTLNACSLVLALVANVILSFNFARRIRYTLAQPLTISLWYLSCLFLVIPVCLTRLPHLSPSTNPAMTYSQSFYYAVISAIIYFTISTLLLLNIIGASRYFRAYPPSFAVLTRPQRTLMLQTILFSLYLALGAGVFSAIEGWSFTDGLYWADYTVLTVGLGTDFPLKKTVGRMLLIPYAPFGIIMVGLLVRSVMGLVMERAKEKVVIRHLGKERDKWTDNINKKLQGEDGVDPPPKSKLLFWHHKRHKKFQQLPHVIAHTRAAQQTHNGKWHHAEFELMRYIQITSEQSGRYIALIVSFFAFLLVWVGGSLVFWATEHRDQQWTYIESIYFTYTTLLTIGYGDFYPVSSAGRPFFVIWSLIAVPTMTVLIGNMGDTVVRAVQEMTDWTGKKTRVLPEYRVEDQPSSDSDSTRQIPTPASAAPSMSAGQTRNYLGLSLVSSPAGEGQEAPATSPLASSFDEEEKQHPSACQKSLQGKRESSASWIQARAEAALLAREISKLAKDVCEQPPKKYRWEEWVIWLSILKEMELEKKIQVSMNLPETDLVEQAHRQNKPHHRYHSQPSPHLKRKDGVGWDWTWLHDRGPLFSPQTETEWILSKLCSRLEYLMSHV